MLTRRRSGFVFTLLVAAITTSPVFGGSATLARTPTEDLPVATALCPETPRSTELPPDRTAASGSSLWFVNSERTLWAAADVRYAASTNKVLWAKPAGTVLAVTGRRLDSVASPLVVSLPSGYPDGFQASALIFPSAGCWEVEAVAAGERMSFVVWVYPPHPPALTSNCQDLADAVSHADAIVVATVASIDAGQRGQLVAHVRVAQPWTGELRPGAEAVVRQSTEFPVAVMEPGRTYLLFLKSAASSQGARAWEVLCPWYTISEVHGDRVQDAPTVSSSQRFWRAASIEALKDEIALLMLVE